MAMAVVQHKVQDYETFRKVYDDFAPQQRAGGVTSASVYQAKDDPNNVLILHHFGSAAEAEAFMGNEEPHTAMGRAGVVGEPRIEFFEEA